MSTTPVAPENASATFANNLGPVVQTVFDGDLTLSVPDCTTDPCNFDVMVPLQTPFLYNPSNGNLVVDWRVNECTDLSIVFDTDSNIQDTELVRIFQTGVNGATGAVDIFGLITQFVIIKTSNVPTLSQWGLIAMAGLLAMVGLIVIRKRKLGINR